MFYQGDFLVSSNIRHECVLGWDFIATNGLTLVAIRTLSMVAMRFLPFSRNHRVRDHTFQGYPGALAMSHNHVGPPNECTLAI